MSESNKYADKSFETLFSLAKGCVSEGRAKLTSADKNLINATYTETNGAAQTEMLEKHANYQKRAGVKKVLDGIDIYAALLCYSDSNRAEKAIISTLEEFKPLLDESTLGHKRTEYFGSLSDNIRKCLGIPD